SQATEIAALCLETPVDLPPDTLRRLLPTPTLLADTDDAVATSAADALQALSHRFGRGGDREALDEALAEAAATWPDHRRDEAIHAVLATAHLAGPFLRTWLQDEHQPGHMALRAAARHLPEDLQRQRTVHWLAIPALATVAVSRLEQDHDITARVNLCRYAHLLPARGRPAMLRRARHLDRRLPTDDDLARVGDDGRLGYARTLRSLPVTRECHVKELTRLLDDPSPRVRMVAALDLARMPADRGADELLVQTCFDADERVATTAAIALTTARTARRRLWLQPTLEHLATSPHASVRRLASEAAGTRESDGAWRWHCPLAERRAFRADPAGFVQTLRAELGGTEIGPRLHALGIIERFRLWTRFEHELRDAARDGDPRIASKAVLLVARVAGDESDHVINAAIRHVDPRVHANAIEAKLARHPSTSWVVRMRNDDVPRARANVIRHIIRQTGGAACSQEILGGMLEDHRPAHRVSALWVAERMNCQTLREQIDTMATADLPGISARAARCSRRLASLGAGRETVA
ncbi:MAG: hypothetical protein KDA21_12700, partial [Phycisphaerales bacterium]|nr:hypothetical protein [Phycisphaerales bacterium]